jgi:lactate dehydrogenase-like 2-hydroxyacid dehydrogenase
LRRSLIERLPNLKMIASTGPINAAIDVKAAEERGIALAHTGILVDADRQTAERPLATTSCSPIHERRPSPCRV